MHTCITGSQKGHSGAALGWWPVLTDTYVRKTMSTLQGHNYGLPCFFLFFFFIKDNKGLLKKVASLFYRLTHMFIFSCHVN